MVFFTSHNCFVPFKTGNCTLCSSHEPFVSDTIFIQIFKTFLVSIFCSFETEELTLHFPATQTFIRADLVKAKIE